MNEIQVLLLAGAVLFSAGLAVIISKKNAVMVLMGIELILNAANLNFIAFATLYPEWHDGQFFALFVIVLAAAEAAVGLALILRAYRFFKTVDLDRMNELKG
jgi:NADH:ubiquinone oxidoreductase subunit K